MPNVETVKVSGMTCGHCVSAVAEEISKIDGVTAVDVELESGRVDVTSSSPVDHGLLAAAVDEAGYALAA